MINSNSLIYKSVSSIYRPYSLFALIICCSLLISCTKDDDLADERDEVVGDYFGIMVRTYWIDTVVGFGKDTTEQRLTLMKAAADSVVDLMFDPAYSNESFSFVYTDSTFTPVYWYHPPTLIKTGDSLYFYHRPGLGPVWFECFAKRYWL